VPLGPDDVPALSAVFLGLNDARNIRPRTAVVAVLVALPLVASVIYLAEVGEPSSDATLLLVLVSSVCGAVAGAVFHPMSRFWWRGLIAGVCTVPVIVLAAIVYTKWRFALTGSIIVRELVIPMGVGSIPGALIYSLLMRNERVTADEAADFIGHR
jgi:hypothetical protein